MKRIRKPRKPDGTQEELNQFKELQQALEAAGIETRVEKGNFRGGFCLIDGEKQILILNKKHPLDHRNLILMRQLKKLDLSSISISDELRERLANLDDEPDSLP